MGGWRAVEPVRDIAEPARIAHGKRVDERIPGGSPLRGPLRTHECPGGQRREEQGRHEQDRTEVRTHPINHSLGRGRKVVVFEIAEAGLMFGVHPQLLPLVTPPARNRRGEPQRNPNPGLEEKAQ